MSWRACNTNYSLYDASHSPYKLLAHPRSPPKVITKSWTSLVLKSWRVNVLDNQNWPSPPDEGWITPDNWSEKVRDVIRTTVVVRYLDGVDIVRRCVRAVAKATSAAFHEDYEAREEGYYALHLTVTLPLRLIGREWEARLSTIPVEIQVCTQVQEVLRALTHRFYERSRLLSKAASAKWQWDCGCDQFVPNYLGHMLHYADGVIMNIRGQEEER